MSAPPNSDEKVKAAFAAFPMPEREGLLALRELIFEVASFLEDVDVTETLKWGQPAYMAAKGTTLRLGVAKSGGFAIFAHCQSGVIPQFRDIVGDRFRIDGNRAVIFDDVAAIDRSALSMMIEHALTYHQPAK